MGDVGNGRGSGRAVDRAGEYVVGPALAAGAFGVVHRAEHAERGTPAAVKILHAELSTSATIVGRFEREVEAIQRVRHPGVVEVWGHGSLPDGRPYFVMELLTGKSLREHLEARGRLSIDEAIAILEPLCSAAAAAHAQAIVHRDIKASNVFLAGERGARRVVLLDFGVAKLLDAEGPGLTGSHHAVGTISCMAPEQILGRPVDARADVYALGMLAYRMLAGQPPFSGRSIALQQMHLYAIPRPPSSVAPVSPALNAPVLRALSKEADARQPGALDFLEELRAAAGRPRAGAETRAGAEQRALAVRVELRVDPEVLEEPDSALLDDMDTILPAAQAELASLGFEPVMETGDSLLLAIALPASPEDDLASRRGAALAVLALERKLAARPGRDARIGVHICLHAAGASLAPDGTPAGGELLRIASWVPDSPSARAIASAAALADLDALRGEPAEGLAGATAWFELRQ